MKLFLITFLILYLSIGNDCAVRLRRQTIPPLATGEIINTAFQIPIQTLNAVRDLVQATRSRAQAVYQAYQQAQQRPNSYTSYNGYNHHTKDSKFVNSKAIPQPEDYRRRSYDY